MPQNDYLPGSSPLPAGLPGPCAPPEARATLPISSWGDAPVRCGNKTPAAPLPCASEGHAVRHHGPSAGRRGRPGSSSFISLLRPPPRQGVANVPLGYAEAAVRPLCLHPSRPSLAPSPGLARRPRRAVDGLAHVPSAAGATCCVKIAEAAQAVATEEAAAGAAGYPPHRAALPVSGAAGLRQAGQYAWVGAATLALPVALPAILPQALPVIFMLGATSVGLSSAWLLAQAMASFASWSDSRALHSRPLPADLPRHLAAVVSAYLPNEMGVLPDTVRNVGALLLPRGAHLTLVVAHNGCNEAQRRALADLLATQKSRRGVRLVDLYVPHSTSKAHNVQAAIARLQQLAQPPKVCALYDADHWPDPQALLYALHSMAEQQAQVLQGRCAVRQGSTLLAAEVDAVYAVHHTGGSVLRQLAFFAGTNGYWDLPTLARTGMDPTMLTEDIDASFVALKAGARIVYDPLVLSSEQAPASWRGLLRQRLRWAQGGSQVSVRHLGLLRHPSLRTKQRAMLFLLLHWRELHFYLTPYLLPAGLSAWRNADPWALPLLGASACHLLLPSWEVLLARYHVGAARHASLNAGAYFKSLTVGPIYDLVKNAVGIAGHYRNLVGLTQWHVTDRQAMPGGQS